MCDFDFYGIITQYVAIKHKAYFVAIEGIEDGIEIFAKIIREFPEMTRYIGCNLFVERARAADIATPNDAILADSYTKACEDAIAAHAAVGLASLPADPHARAVLPFCHYGGRLVK